jgi:hypothetical protein
MNIHKTLEVEKVQTIMKVQGKHKIGNLLLQMNLTLTTLL